MDVDGAVEPVTVEAVVVELEVAASGVEGASAAAWSLGAWSIEERAAGGGATRLVIGFADRLRASVAAAAMGGTVAAVADGWQDGWRAHARVQRAGTRLVLRPMWVPLGPARDDELVIGLDLGRAFGDGGHPTTRLALAALEEVVRVGDRVLDVGCGSGVLSIAAVLLGAATAHGLDVDPHAVAVTRSAAIRNGVAAAVTTSVGDIHAFAADAGADRDVTVANIGGTAVLVGLAPALDRSTTRVLILGGMLVGREGPAVEALAGWRVQRTWTEGAWSTVALGRRR